MDEKEGEAIKKMYDSQSKICFLSNFPPKECGIATFTKDLITAMNKRFNPKLKSRVIALNDDTSFYDYTDEVILELNREDIEDYINMAKTINKDPKTKLVCIQHEFGIFGGEYGNYIIPFLETLEKPAVITFHSVLPNQDEKREKIVRFICEKSSAVIVLAKKAIDILVNDYGIEENKIHLIHHGIPNVPFISQHHLKKKLNLPGKIVLSTFGLLSRGKGIEYAIRALPKLVKKYPNLIYLIIGETHPTVREDEGESYRNKLKKEVKSLGLQNHVKFYNKYLTLPEIINYLLATDVYLCTNLDKNQISSGPLAYAMGSGKAVVSTPITYAKELLSDERGLLTKFKKPESFAQQIEKILSDPELKSKLEKNAYAFGRKMIWSNVASNYLSIFNKIVELREETLKKYPKIKLAHLKNMTDKIGIIQFAKHSTPDKNSGYTVDDNSRALIVAVTHNKLFSSLPSHHLSKIYLNFLEHVQNPEGKFKNNLNNKNEIQNPESEDSFGRALWALGYTINKSQNPEIIEQATRLFNNSKDKIKEINSPRAKAFSILGLYHYYKEYHNQELLEKINLLADSLIDLYEKQSSEDWLWFEPYLTYSNSKLPEALFLAYKITKKEKYLEIAEKTLKFLTDIVFIDDKLHPIGHNGWHNRNGERALFDQQPIDASSMVQTYLIAYNITKNPEYQNKAHLAFNWFLGKNHLQQMIYDESTGGCFDGLGKEALNFNQGAESTLSYLIARLFLEEVKRST